MQILDGPAEGEAFAATRFPKYLRITQNGTTFRCLAEEWEEPEEPELAWVYVRTSRKAEPPATYAFLRPQPKESHIFYNHSWRGWVTRRIAEIKARQQAPH
jgi:hypothetical protein